MLPDPNDPDYREEDDLLGDLSHRLDDSPGASSITQLPADEDEEPTLDSIQVEPGLGPESAEETPAEHQADAHPWRDYALGLLGSAWNGCTKQRLQGAGAGAGSIVLLWVLGWVFGGSSTPEQQAPPATQQVVQQEPVTALPSEQPPPAVASPPSGVVTQAPPPAAPSTPVLNPLEVPEAPKVFVLKADITLNSLVSYTIDGNQAALPATDALFASLQGGYVLVSSQGSNRAYKRSNTTQVIKQITITQKGIVIAMDGAPLTDEQKNNTVAIATALGLPSRGSWANSTTYVFH